MTYSIIWGGGMYGGHEKGVKNCMTSMTTILRSADATAVTHPGISNIASLDECWLPALCLVQPLRTCNSGCWWSHMSCIHDQRRVRMYVMVPTCTLEHRLAASPGGYA